MFKNPEFQQHSTVDKRGRKVEKRKNQENMRKYYKLKDEVRFQAPTCRVTAYAPHHQAHAAGCGDMGNLLWIAHDHMQHPL